MTRTFLVLIQLFFSLTILFSQEITNIHFEQEGKMINIYYDLSDEGIYDVRVYCSQDGGNTWGNPLTQVIGAVGKGLKASYGNKIVWDVLTEREKLSGDIKFKIEALSGNETGTFVDKRDGKIYKWVKIGNQIWMAENLAYITDSCSWCYDIYSSNCNIYGRLYSWNSANVACPTGWHLPSDSEWTVLTDYLGGASIAGGKMKEIGTIHWESPNIDANNESGFTALPGGHCDTAREFNSIGYVSIYWSSSESIDCCAWRCDITHNRNDVVRFDWYKNVGFSVRCLKDN